MTVCVAERSSDKLLKMIPIANPIIDEDEISAVVAVLRSGIIAQGKNVEEFEGAFAQFIGTGYAVATNSGTAALHIALLAQGIGEGDEVIASPFTFIATANSILFTGAGIAFVGSLAALFFGLIGRIMLVRQGIHPVY